jgi:hypothetical protein
MSGMSALLLAELARALRSGRLWMSVLRNAIPLAGVWLLGWPAILALLYYLLEIWLYLSLRASVSLALDDAGGTPAARAVLAAAGMHLLLVAPLIGAVLGLVAWFAVRMVADGWSELGAHRWELAAGVAAVAVFALVDALQYMRHRIAGRRSTEDQLREVAIAYRAACLTLAGIPIYFLVPRGYDAYALVLFIAAASVWIEAAPRHATRAFGMPARSRRRLFHS